MRDVVRMFGKCVLSWTLELRMIPLQYISARKH